MHNPPMISGPTVLVLVAVAAAAHRLRRRRPTTGPPQWSFISATIIEPSCATVNCHSEIANRAGVDLHDRATGYSDLTARNFVFPGDQTNSSALLYLLKRAGLAAHAARCAAARRGHRAHRQLDQGRREKTDD